MFNRKQLCGMTLGLLAIVGLGLSAWGEFVQAPKVSVERLLKNTAAYIKEHPQDPQGYYVHGRLHHLAYAMNAKDLPIFNADKTDKPLTLDERSIYIDRDNPQKLDDATIAHIKEGLANYRKALELDPKRPLYHLSLASLMESASSPVILKEDELEKPTEAEQKKIEDSIKALGGENPETRENAFDALYALGSKALTQLQAHGKDEDLETRTQSERLITVICQSRAAAEYLQAFNLGKDLDLKATHQPLDGIASMISHEAGSGFLRLVQKRKLSDAEKTAANEVEAHLKKLQNLPQGPITPIVFSLTAGKDAKLADLLDNAKTVRFDLDGDERAELRHWVQPTTCILVWDPDHKGKIVSGRQLFGSVTWWMFWNDGYHALDALDDNRDGTLSGAELDGLAVWRDANRNGISDPGEVVPLTSLGIVSLSVRKTHSDGQAPACRDGVRLSDGTVLPSFDWIAEGVPEPVPEPAK